jgi:hypothetical protein
MLCTDFLEFEVGPEDTHRRILSSSSKASKTLDALGKYATKLAQKNN